MSDSVQDLVAVYDKDVSDYPRSIGLFTIPEYPELEGDRGMWSSALDALLTTLRYLAPATLLTLFWGQQSFLFKILKHIDAAFRAIVFSSEEQKQEVLKWLAEAGPVRVEHLDTVWRHGWILCGALDAVLPGACAGHPPTRLSLKHAQAIADHYLGVEPVFSRSELESNDSLSHHQEWKLANYLNSIREALSKLSPPVSKPVSQRTSPESSQITLDYAAKGPGLIAAQINNKMYFKIYPTAQQTLEPGEITILIKGPKNTYGMTVLPPVFGKAQLIRQKLLGLQSKPNYTEHALPTTQGATYLRSYGKNDMNKTYYIPKTKYDIDIEAEIRPDHVKVIYHVTLEGRYEISISSRGQGIVGSPFSVKASNNMLEMLEKDSFCLDDGEEIDIVDVKTDRKVVLRIVDFVTEKMLLRENGTLELISEDEAKLLMATNSIEKPVHDDLTSKYFDTDELKWNSNKFNTVAKKILKMNKVCRTFNNLMLEKQLRSQKRDTHFLDARNPAGIPDIVNSTFAENNVNQYVLPEKRDKYIIPENITVSLTTEKPKALYHEEINKSISQEDSSHIQAIEEMIQDDRTDDDNMSIDRMAVSSNPFLTDFSEDNYNINEKGLGSFVTTEYEANNSQNEETRDSSIKIIIESTESTPSPLNNNPFLDDIIHLERPKSPVYKIVAGEKFDHEGPVYIEPKAEFTDEVLGNEFINPFFVHQHKINDDNDLEPETTEPHQQEKSPVTDFIIGAPVSLPPIIRSSSPLPDVKCGKMNRKENVLSSNIQGEENNHDVDQVDNISRTIFSAPMPENLQSEENNTEISTFHSLESNLTMDNSNASTTSDNQYEPYRIEGLQSNRNVSPRKDTWDSAYVSIDDGSPDNNNNENLDMGETQSKQKLSPSDENLISRQEKISHMGPAERELWQTCSDLKTDSHKVHDEIRPSRWEIKRPMFTPIIEESDRSISSGMKESRTETHSKHGETDPITVAFAELNDLYQEYFPKSESSSTFASNEDNKLHCTDVEYLTEAKNINVNSASDVLSDVKRHTETIEGTISEVQANVTESVSVSQNLHTDDYEQTLRRKNIDETQFGDRNQSNIVLERKKYWDEKIRQIEATTEESTKHQKKKRLSSKQLKHNDSLSKRKGKQVIKNFLNAGESQLKQAKSASNNVKEASTAMPEFVRHVSLEPEVPEENLVEKWKKYWDDKLETDSLEVEAVNLRAKSPRNKEYTHNTDLIPDTKGKQELPEEVFKAFETSPKRFFGTSRKHILSKIDTFLGKPNTEEIICQNVRDASHDSGLVSSRISLFHKISNMEELPTRKKTQSLQNINANNVSETEIDSEKESSRIKRTEYTDIKNPKEIVQSSQKVPTLTSAEKAEGIKDTITLKEKRARMVHKIHGHSFDETANDIQKPKIVEKPHLYVKKATRDYHKPTHIDKYKKDSTLRKSSISKSDMDIFNKAKEETDDYLEKYKSCDELPKINVKNFISMYENVSKTSVAATPANRIHRTSSIDSQKLLQTIGMKTDGANKLDDSTSRIPVERSTSTSNISKDLVKSRKQWLNKSLESISVDSVDTNTNNTDSFEIVSEANDDNETTYMSLSDIEIEIVEKSPEKSKEPPPEKKVEAHIEYKSRFKMAKQFFQSLEELREEKKPRKLNECELLLHNKSTESLEHERPQKRVKKNIKSHSMPSSEISKIWNQLQGTQKTQNEASPKLVKISEKFNVDDLFSDVMEGRLSRQGSLRGIPHKNAVLEAFRSMENVADSRLSPYELATTQLSDFSQEKEVKNAQTYLTEYPYLPTTDPSKYHSRLDTKASGLISFKELLDRRPRRNSVPDLRLNPKFTADL